MPQFARKGTLLFCILAGICIFSAAECDKRNDCTSCTVSSAFPNGAPCFWCNSTSSCQSSYGQGSCRDGWAQTCPAFPKTPQGRADAFTTMCGAVKVDVKSCLAGEVPAFIYEKFKSLIPAPVATPIINRSTQGTFIEFVPALVGSGFEIMYNTSVGLDLMRTSEVRAALKSMSVSYGSKYNESARATVASQICCFAKVYNIPYWLADEPVTTFKTFNDFFHRKLVPNSRPIASQNCSVVSPADSRVVVFPNVTVATRLWIKGKDFSLPELLNHDSELVRKFPSGSSVLINRLTPQDYHRWHFPLRGRLGHAKSSYIPGAYYGVNPIAMHVEPISILSQNKRTITTLDTEFGTVAMVVVGATNVASITLTKDMPGAEVDKGEEHGYFSFGGSTVAVLFQPGMVEFDSDLLSASLGYSPHGPIETYVNMGEKIGDVRKCDSQVSFV